MHETKAGMAAAVPRGLSWRAAGVACCLALIASQAVAAEWPAESQNLWVEGQQGRGPGGGLSILLVSLWWLWVPLWAACSSWVAKDMGRWKLSPIVWPLAMVFPFFLSAVAAWWIPSAIAGLAIMGVAWAVPTFTYVIVRNGRAPNHEKVLTPGHMLDCLADALRPMGIKIKRSPKEVKDSLPVVQLADASGKPVIPASEDEAQASQDAAGILSIAIAARAMKVMIERNAATATVRQLIDGVWSTPRKPAAQGIFASKKDEDWENVPAPTPKSAAGVVAAFEKAGGIEAAGRKPRRQGRLVGVSDGKSIPLGLEVASSDAIERAVISLELPIRPITSILELGVAEKVAEKLQTLLSYDRGLIVLAAAPSNGLPTTFDVVVNSADRMVRDFASLEDARDPPAEIQNIKRCTWDTAEGVSPIDALTLAMRAYPQGIVTRNLTDAALAKQLFDMASGDQLVIVSVTATDAVDAVAQLLKLGVSRNALSRAVVGVLAGRLIRRLCPRCREAFATPPDLAAKLRIPVERVPQLWRASAIGCRLCRGLGYASRTGIFELAGGETFSQAILKGDRKLLSQAAVKDGMRPLGVAALDMVLAGETSLEERQRVLQKG
jgi:type II secretory ATPase GspE/PulE/Tfp pilus assembly ATPase PilB-like protein